MLKKEIKITYILLSVHKRYFCCKLELEEWRIRLPGLLRLSESVNISRLHPLFVRFHPTFGGGRSLEKQEAHKECRPSPLTGIKPAVSGLIAPIFDAFLITGCS